MFTLMAPTPSAAQKGDPQKHIDREAFFARRNAYITAEAGLTADEAAAFIPLENELQRRKMEVGRECRKLARSRHSPFSRWFRSKFRLGRLAFLEDLAPDPL